jgi:hypothetical protein
MITRGYVLGDGVAQVAGRDNGTVMFSLSALENTRPEQQLAPPPGRSRGFGAPPSVDSILAATPTEQSAAGSAVGDAAMQFGGALGIALMGSLAATAATGRPATGWAVGAAVVGTGAVLAFNVLPRRPARDSQEQAQGEQQPVGQVREEPSRR